MATPPRITCQVLRSTDSFTPGGGWDKTPSTTTATANVDFVGPTQLVGADMTPFTLPIVAGRGQITVPFYNLPNRSRGNVITNPSPLRPFRNTQPLTYIQPMSQLLFEAQTMQLEGFPDIRIEVAPRAYDHTGVLCPGPYLGGGRRFRNFHVVVTASNKKPGATGNITGYVVGRLHLAAGA